MDAISVSKKRDLKRKRRFAWCLRTGAISTLKKRDSKRKAGRIALREASEADREVVGRRGEIYPLAKQRARKWHCWSLMKQ
jgi:hypothetical protein